MKKINVTDYIESLGVKLPPLEEFWKLGDMTALWANKNNEFVRLNYYRGPLLYALVAKYKPKRILEFGMAKGYATLCMAWAMSDHKIDGEIYSIDNILPDQPITTPIKRSNQDEHYESLSVKEIWKDAAKHEWLKNVKILSGYSGEVMANTKLENVDFAFIDGGHFYEAVKHDFLSFLKVSSNNFGVLFDDYLEKDGWGVKKFIDNEVAQNFDVTLIRTDVENNLERLAKSDYGMCWIDSNSLKRPIEECYKINEVDKFLKKYRNYERRLKIRNVLNQKIPLLKKVRLRWWKN